MKVNEEVYYLLKSGKSHTYPLHDTNHRRLPIPTARAGIIIFEHKLLKTT